MKEKKVLHVDQDRKEVFRMVETKPDGSESGDYVEYEGSDLKYVYLSPREVATLILLGYEIRQCYVERLTVEDLLDTHRFIKEEAEKRKNSSSQPLTEVIDELINRVLRLCQWFPGSSNLYKRVLDIRSAIESPFTKKDSKSHGGDDTADTDAELERMETQFITKKETRLKRNVAFCECIIGELNLKWVTIDGGVQLNRDEDKPRTKEVALGEDRVSPEQPPNTKPTYVFDVDLTLTKLTTSVYFFNTIVLDTPDDTSSGNCIFRALQIKENLQLAYSKFFRRVEANEAQIGDSIYAGHCEFYRTADFGKLKVKGNSYFGHAKFLGPEMPRDLPRARFGAAYFDNAEFGGNVSFENTKFNWDVHFEKTTFHRYASFSKEITTDEDPSDGAHFRGDAYFERTQFLGGNNNFSGVSFNGRAIFKGAYFKQNAWFRKTKFVEPVDFSHTTFNGNLAFYADVDKEGLTIPRISFYRTRFSKAFDMRKTHFKQATFELATFTEPLRLQDAIFEDVDFQQIVAPELRMSFDAVDPSKSGLPVLKAHRKAREYEKQGGHEDAKNYWEQSQQQYAMLKENFRKLGQYEDEDKAHWHASECGRMMAYRF